MKLIKQLSFLLIVFIFFTRASLAQVTVSDNNQTETITSPITSTVNDEDPPSILGVGIYNDGFTGLIINNSSNISITSTGRVNPYGIGILSSTFTSSVTSITNSGIITSTTTGAAALDGNSYGITNNATLAKYYQEQADERLREARFIDATENSISSLESNEFTDARL